MIKIIDFLSKHIKRIRTFSVIGSAALLLWAAIKMDTHHAHTWVEMHIPDFWFLFASLSALVLIVISCLLGKNIQISEDYYDK
ncbi:MAG: hypothetical protein OCC45_09675 [Desulfotalea sp.]